MLESKSKKGKSPKKGIKNIGRPSKRSINDLNENDREIYQEIMEMILEKHNIPLKEVTDELKRIKEKKDKDVSNLKALTEVLRIQRTSAYNPLRKKRKASLLKIMKFLDYWIE